VSDRSTGDESGNGGTNYPDSADKPGETPGQAGMREDVVGGALAPDAAENSETNGDASDPAPGGGTATEAPKATDPARNTQDEPAMDGNDASHQDKVDGIAAQTKMDVGGEGHERIAEVLRQRFDDAGMSVTDEDRAALAQRIAGS